MIKKMRIFVKNIITRYIDHDLSQLGGQVAFFSILSVLPFVVYINTLLISFNFSRADLSALLTPAVPAYVIDIILSYIDYISTQSGYGVLSIGIIATIFSASKMVRSIEKSINRAYSIKQRRGFIKSVIIAMVFIICIGIAVIATLYFVVIGANIAHAVFDIFHLPMSILDRLENYKWLTFIAALFFTISVMYLIMPYKKIKYKTTIPGTVFSLLMFGVLSEGFTLYIKYGFSLSSFYGPLGAVFLLFIWLYLISIILILGAEINSELEEMKKI